MGAMRVEEASGSSVVRLGLIGSNIHQSRSPELHRLCGAMTGMKVTYELLIPDELNEDFDGTFDACVRSGMRGINVTYPYKERVVPRVSVPDREVARVGSINTVVFGRDGPIGYNTDYTGFAAAYREAFGGSAPGRVALIGAGGVGRAIAFALIDLGATKLSVFDRIPEKAAALGRELAEAGLVAISVHKDAASAVSATDGVVNATPVGMSGLGGSPVPAGVLGTQQWAFDAVYTPVETEFKRQAETAGLSFLSGFALFFHQGIEAFELFTGRRPQELGVLRQQLQRSAPV